MRVFVIAAIIVASLHSTAVAGLNVVATYPWIAEIVRAVGGERVSVKALASGDWDPHHVVPRPSLIVKVKHADLLFINGAELEIGWLPALIRSANNPRVIPGSHGLVDLSRFVDLIQKPMEGLSRADGDVHHQGNPHYALDPANIPILTEAVANILCNADANGCAEYRKNLSSFARRWADARQRWDALMEPHAGVKVVEYHSVFDYFFQQYKIDVVGAIEPIPGMPPTARHTKELVAVIKREQVGLIAQDVYHTRDAADYLAGKTGSQVTIIPHDVGAVKGADNLFSLFDTIVSGMAP